MNFEQYRKSYEDFLLGTAFEPNTPDGKAVLSSMQLVLQESQKPAPHKVPFDSPVIYLRALAAAYRTPGMPQYNRSEVIEEVLRTFEQVKSVYNKDTFGEKSNIDNWWQVQVGNPLRILDTLVLLYDALPECDALVTYWTDLILYYQNAYSISNRNRSETGANLMWKCHVCLIVGILQRDEKLVEWAKSQIPIMLQYSRKISHPQAGTFYDDGFYPDGSFMQHYFTAYTGGYGKHLINILAGLVYAFKDTDLHLLSEAQTDFLCKTIIDCYAPCMVDGRFLDVVRGREVSRWFYQDHICGRHIMRSLCYLACALPKEKTSQLRALLKLWLSKGENRAKICVDETAFAEYYVYPSLPEVLAQIDVEQPAPEQWGHYNFGPMCKTVHRHGKWSAAISMFSKTTACYEYLAGESATCWHISDGVTYLYTTDIDQYNHNYYATVDMQRLPGTTVDRSPTRAQDPPYSWFMPESKNPCAFAGGVQIGHFGIVGMEYLGQGKHKERNLAVKKSWFFLGDEIVCLGSGITSPTGDMIETTILNHRLIPGGENLLTTQSYTGPCRELPAGVLTGNTLHLAGNNGPGSDIGVVLGDTQQVELLFSHRLGSWNSAVPQPGFVDENDFFTMWYAHGSYPENASYHYTLLPGVSAAQTAAYAADPKAEVLAHTTGIHAVRHKNTGCMGVLFWDEKGGSFADIAVNAQACIMTRQMGTEWILAVSDPTKEDALLEVTVQCSAQGVVRADDGIEVVALSPLTIRVDTTGQNGNTLALVVQK